MQPFQYDLRDPAATDNSIMQAAAAPSNLGAATTMRFADAELRNTKNYAQRRRKLQLHNRISTPKRNTILKHFFNRNFKRKLLAPKLRKSADKSLSQP